MRLDDAPASAPAVIRPPVEVSIGFAREPRHRRSSAPQHVPDRQPQPVGTMAMAMALARAKQKK
jgi:hypothetical protein